GRAYGRGAAASAWPGAGGDRAAPWGRRGAGRGARSAPGEARMSRSPTRPKPLAPSPKPAPAKLARPRKTRQREASERGPSERGVSAQDRTDRMFVNALARGLEILRVFNPSDGALGN